MTDQTVSYDADELIAEAKSQTGFDDFGEPPYSEGLEVLLETYDRHVKDSEGRKRCRDRVVTLLATRLKCEHAFNTIPAIAGQEIKAPIFVTGLPRSGTSALLNLLVSAPDNRGLLQWEVQFPDPWLDSRPGQEDPRYSSLVRALEQTRNPEVFKRAFQPSFAFTNSTSEPTDAKVEPSISSSSMTKPKRSSKMLIKPTTAIESRSGRAPNRGVSRSNWAAAPSRFKTSSRIDSTSFFVSKTHSNRKNQTQKPGSNSIPCRIPCPVKPRNGTPPSL